MSGVDQELLNLVQQAGRAIGEARQQALASLASVGIDPRANDDIARREWPHVPLSIARAYADEYVRTGERP